MQRLFDLTIATLVLIVTAPLLIIIALVLRVEGSGSLLYRRRCVGRHGQPFDLLRFRTMVDTPVRGSPEQRLTPVGRFIRNYSLDELPLFFNVLRGEMSIVGPRPTQPEFVDLNDPVWQQILAVRPGVISYAVLHLARTFNSSSQSVRNQLEIEYLRRKSFRFDLGVLRSAAQALIASRGNVKARGAPSAGPADV